MKNTNNRMIATLMMPLALTLLSAPASSWAVGGSAEGNGGDGVYVDGKLTLRDFIQSNSGRLSQVSNNDRFLRKVNDLIPLLREIGAVHPALAQEIWHQLEMATIWTTQGPLPLLPDAVTSVVGPKAQVQIAIRDESDIVISTPAFNQVEKSYVLVHEALHGMIEGDGPMHHERVRTVVRYLHDHRGHYSAAELENVLDRNGVYARSLFSSDKGIEKLWKTEDEAMKVFMEGRGSDANLCALETVLGNLYYGMYANSFATPEAGCPQQDLAKSLTSISPEIGKYLTKISGPNAVTPGPSTYIFEINYKPSWWERTSNKDLMKWLHDQCRQYADPKFQTEIDAAKSKAAELLAFESQMQPLIRQAQQADIQSSPDPAATAVVKLAMSVPRAMTSLQPGYQFSVAPLLVNPDAAIAATTKDLNEDLPTLSKALQDNVQSCTENFGPGYLNP